MGMLWDYWYAPVATQEGVREVATPFKTKSRSCTDVICLVFFLICLAGWVAVAVIAFRDGDPKKVLYPTNSRGEVCGQGERGDRPYMMLFDISRCIGLSPAVEGCPTPSTCVAECPDITWEWAEGKVEGLEQFCQTMEQGVFEETDLEELITLRLCPAFLVPQRPLFNRCLPKFTFPKIEKEPEVNSTEVENASNKTEDITTGEMDYDGQQDSPPDPDSPLLPSLPPRTVVDLQEADPEEREEVRRGPGEELEEDNLILPHPSTVLKMVEVRRDRTRRNAFVVADTEENHKVMEQEVEEASGEEEASGDGVLMALFSRDSLENSLEGNLSKREVNLSDLAEGSDQQRRMLLLRSTGERLLWDLSTYWWQLLMFLLLSFLLSLAWVLLLSCCAKPTVWLSLLLCTIGLSGILAIHSYNQYDALLQVTEEKDDIFLTTWERITQVVTSSSTFWLGLTILFTTLAVILSLTLGCCMQRLRVATEMISEASKAIRDIQGSLLLPLFPFLLHILLVGWAVTVGLFLLSARTPQYRLLSGCPGQNCTDGGSAESWTPCTPQAFTNCSSCPQAACVFYRYGSDTLHLVLQWYNLFAALWTAAFISATGDIILAGAVSAWYWTFNKAELPSNMLGSSVKRTFRYHLGTVAFGSLLLALVQLLRVVVEYLNDRINNLQAQNRILRSIVWFLRGCFFFLEKLIRYLNRNAYIMTGMVGSSFCQASQDAFTLITSNILRGFFVNQVADFVILLGKIFVVGVTTLFFSMTVSGQEEELHFSFIPILLVMVGSYIVASSCLAVYSVAVDTLFLCFLKDVQINDGGWRKPYYMSKNLMKIMKYENI